MSIYVNCKHGKIIDIDYGNKDGYIEPHACVSINVYTKWLLERIEQGKDPYVQANLVETMSEIRGMFYEYILVNLFGIDTKKRNEGHKTLTKAMLEPVIVDSIKHLAMHADLNIVTD